MGNKYNQDGSLKKGNKYKDQPEDQKPITFADLIKNICPNCHCIPCNCRLRK